jgi:hypothetical protein
MILSVCNEFKGDKMNKRVVTHSMLAVSVAALIVGCGGSGSRSDIPGSTQTVTGTFVDAGVDGLDYDCSTGTDGVTHDGGQFTCNEGDTVTFKIGEYMLGSVKASSGIVTPYTLSPEDETIALNIAQLLQTIDSDGDPENGIMIPDEVKEVLDGVELKLDNPDFDTLMANYLGESLVPEADAVKHLDETIQSLTDLTELLSGKTVYTSDDLSGTMERWTFSDDMKQITWQEISGGDDQGLATILSVQGMEITLQDDEGESTVTVLRILPDYLDVKIVTAGETDYTRLYFDQENISVGDSVGPLPVPELTELFAGKTLYTTIDMKKGTLESWNFNEDASSVTWTEIAGGDERGSGSLSIDGMTMTYTEENEQTEIVVKSLYSDYVVVTIGDGEEQKLYFNEDKAMKYLLLAGQTLYTAIDGEMGTLESWEFNEDASSVTWSEMIGGDGEAGSGTLRFDGLNMIYTEGTESTTISVENIQPDYMEIAIGDSEETRLYYDEEKARAYFLQQ